MTDKSITLQNEQIALLEGKMASIDKLTEGKVYEDPIKVM
jgi:hypothetical protein